jgi:hypothetical protein
MGLLEEVVLIAGKRIRAQLETGEKRSWVGELRLDGEREVEKMGGGGIEVGNLNSLVHDPTVVIGIFRFSRTRPFSRDTFPC